MLKVSLSFSSLLLLVAYLNAQIETGIPKVDYETRVQVVAEITSFDEASFHADGIDLEGNTFVSIADQILLKIKEPKEFEGKDLLIYREHHFEFDDSWKKEGTEVHFTIPIAYLKAPYVWEDGGRTEIYTDINGGDIQDVKFKKHNKPPYSTRDSSAAIPE